MGYSFKRVMIFCSLILLLSSCAKDFINPYDPATPADIWMPSELTIDTLGRNALRLSWQQEELHIDGFILGKEQAGTLTETELVKDSLQMADLLAVDDDTCRWVSYQVSAFAGDNRSTTLYSYSVQFPLATLANAGPDQYLEQGTQQTTLAANSISSGEVGQWEIISGSGGNLDSLNSPSATFSGNLGQMYVLRWNVSACNTSSDEVVISFGAVGAAVATLSVGQITSTTALAEGEVFSDGGSPLTGRGFCWSEQSTPTVNDDTLMVEGTIGSFSSLLSSLAQGVEYHLRAFATNGVGTTYGDEITFTTLTEPPTVETIPVSGITATTANIGGNVTSDGGVSVTVRGVCWSTSENPTTADNTTTDGSGTGSYSSSITGLVAGTTYYMRAYATNTVGTGYGNEVSFTAGTEPPAVTTTAVTNITSNGATSGGNVTSSGGTTVTVRGVCWSTSPSPTTANNTTTDGSGTGSYSSSITGLVAATTYYVRAYATNTAGTGYGNEVSFTAGTEPPTVTTTTVTNITSSGATSGGNVTSDGGVPVTVRGVCWSTSPSPTTANNTTTDGSGTGSYSSSITGLTAGTTYYVRAYATNTAGTGYGNEVSFTAETEPPTVTTTTVTNITSSGATSGGNVTSSGGATVTVRGVCWSTSPSPTTANNTTTDGSGTGSYSSSITGLTAGTTYYVRAYATNTAGTGYGNEVSFTAGTEPPTVTTATLTNITSSGATSGGNVTSSGGTTVTVRGVCWSTSPSPTTADNTTSNGSGTGSYSSSITGLLAGTTYYARAYATNTAGTAYGNEVSFTAGTEPPTVTTTTLTNITSSGATSGGNVISAGGTTVTSRGVCWSTSQNPTTADNTTSDGSGTGSYSSSITGLLQGMTYYIRAYATNAEGTAYGNQLVFTTNNLPTVVTSGTSSITQNSATISGNVTSDGGTTVTSRGICWSTSANPTTADNVVASGSGTGSFNSNLTSLDANTTYHARAYATNGLGTAYGADLQFTTLGPCAGQTTVTYNGYSYPLVEIGNQCWFQDNLKTASYRNGVAIPNETDPNSWYNDMSGVWINYANNPSFDDAYGKLYSGYTVTNSNGICPTGWHVPDNAEWFELFDLYGGQYLAGEHLKDVTPYFDGLNTSGYTGRAGGETNSFGDSQSGGVKGSWWSSEATSAFQLKNVTLQDVDIDVGYQTYPKNTGASIRCIKDQ